MKMLALPKQYHGRSQEIKSSHQNLSESKPQSQSCLPKTQEITKGLKGTGGWYMQTDALSNPMFLVVALGKGNQGFLWIKACIIVISTPPFECRLTSAMVSTPCCTMFCTTCTTSSPQRFKWLLAKRGAYRHSCQSFAIWGHGLKLSWILEWLPWSHIKVTRSNPLI